MAARPRHSQFVKHASTDPMFCGICAGAVWNATLASECSALARSTPVRGPAGHPAHRKRPAATGTSAPGLADAQEFSHWSSVARQASGGPPQHGADRIVEPRDVGGPQGAECPRRMQAGLEQDLIGVNVADPGDHVLTQQQRLERAPPPL